ncbi:HAD hydrolase-like protein [Xenorhabdus bovienii]|uniref:HAD hydrolase-like protein n=1 Tax=Xenorhabdus bovienii TaxID=40576 RepID=UPI0004D6E2EF|nr:HAD hydrolase-like protein [Xenorhabdus bovienii]CDG89901.1 Haloacid dehalogenase superfamily enzyme,subfamily IA [Xenorhabdus bovienii str. feltiae France]CDG92150.1 Haloacid dehalogenase superfamily enzyme,subfamily IA [Xenorhabdus bovienii str. feltiae Florida]
MKIDFDAVFFDLDNTLISTDSLKQIRESGNSSDLTHNALSQTKIYSKSKYLLNYLKSHDIKTALITNSPKKYVQSLLEYYSIKDLFNEVITYNDVLSNGAKPSPKGIEMALGRLGLTRGSKVVYFGDDDKDFIAAYSAGIKPLAPAWASRNPFRVIPSAIISTSAFIDDIDCFESIDLIADICASRNKFVHSRKWLYFMPMTLSGEVGAIKKDKIEIVCLGKYFSQKGVLTARLHDEHSLSLEIAKKDCISTYVMPEYIVSLIQHCIHRVSQYFFGEIGYFDLVTVIPSKKNKNPRLENMLGRVSKQGFGRTNFIGDLFYFEDGAVSLKTLGNKENRDLQIKEKLKIKEKYLYLVKNKRILVIDDVITTGSTLQGAFNLLNQYTPQKILGLCLAKTVSVTGEHKICPECGRALTLRKGHPGIRFWGCTGFYEADKCRYTLNIKEKQCPICGLDMHKKYNKKDGRYFLGCSGYYNNQSCTYTEDAN